MDLLVILHVPKLMKDTYHKTTCIRGDHGLAGGGTVELVYPSDKAAFTGKCGCARDVYRNTHVDYERNIHTYQFLEGEVREVCTFFSGTVEVVPTDSGKLVVKHRVEYELIDEGSKPHSVDIQEKITLELLRKMEQHLKANQAEYL